MATVTWFQIPATDMERAVNFYKELLDSNFYSHEADGLAHAFFLGDGGIPTGEIIKGDGYQPSTTGSTVFIRAKGLIEDALEFVKNNGGQVILPVTELEDGYKFAIILDSEGNRVGIRS